MSFAHYPPVEGDFLVSKLWDELMRPEWREGPSRQHELESKEHNAKIVSEINEIAESPRSSASEFATRLRSQMQFCSAKGPFVSGQMEMLRRD